MATFAGAQNRDTILAAQQNLGPEERVVPAMLDVVFMALLRNTAFQDEARRFVRVNQFNPVTEAHYALLWDVLTHMRDQGLACSNTTVCAEIHRVLHNNPMCIHPSFHPLLLQQDSHGLVWSAFTSPESDIDVNAARFYMRHFLRERAIATPLRRFMEGVEPGETPMGLDDFLTTLTRQREMIQSLNTLPLVATVPSLTATLAPSAVMHPSGVDWIDSRILGFREGDVVGVLGVTGGGKSTLGAHIAVACAKREYTNARTENREGRWVAFFTYEEDVKKMQPRIWSAGMQIKRDRLADLTSPALQLSTRDNLQSYERNLFGPNSTETTCEQERWQAASVWLNKHLALFDMSGSTDFPNAGRGYIPEVVACLDAHQHQLGTMPLIVVIDYVGLMVRNYMNHNNLREDQLRTMLTEFGNQARREIAERFRCTVVALHQMAPSEGGKSPTALLHHTMAQESKAFAENMAACACIGTADTHTGCRRINWSKIRYRQQERVEPVTVRINDEYSLMDDVSTAYVVDEASRRIITRDAAAQMHGSAAAATNEATAESQATTVSPNPPAIETHTGRASPAGGDGITNQSDRRRRPPAAVQVPPNLNPTAVLE